MEDEKKPWLGRNWIMGEKIINNAIKIHKDHNRDYTDGLKRALDFLKYSLEMDYLNN